MKLVETNELTTKQLQYSKIHDIITQTAKEYSQKANDIFEKAVRNNATPPIRGEITKGKLRNRGIKLIIHPTDIGCQKWLEQRGKIISPRLNFNFNIFEPPTHNK